MTNTMNCAEFQAIAGDLLEGVPAPSPAAAHRQSCENCRAYLGDLAALQDGLRALKGPGAPPELWSRIEARLAAEDTGARSSSRILRFAVAACAAALLTIVALISHDASSRNAADPRSRICFMPMVMGPAEETEDSVVDPLARMLLSSASFDEK